MKVKGQEIKSEIELISTLDRMYDLSKNGDEPFYNLIEMMKNEQTILSAVHNIKSNKGSKTVGVDSKDIDYYLQMPSRKLIGIIRKAINNYRPLPVRREYIPKGNGKERPLGIPTMLDRIIQEIARMVIEPIVEAKFFKHSYGFRPYRSTEHAIARIIDLIRRNNFYYVIEGDIKSFFDNINHNKLIEIMWGMGIKDKRYLSIIKKMLKAGIMDDGVFFDSELGTPQGGIISPVLANIYLNGFDWMVANLWEEHYASSRVTEKNKHRYLRNGGHTPCWLVRYADDWVILCDSQERAEQVLNVAYKYLKHVLKLELSAEKTVITDVRKKPIKFLGFDIIAEKARMKDIIVGKAIPNRNNLNKKVNEVLKEINKLQVFKHDHDRAAHIELINSKIVGISNYYSIGNSSFLMKKHDAKIDYRAFKTFRKIYGHDWKKMRLPAKNLNNRIDRHKDKNTQVYFINVDDVNIGITRFSFTASRKALNFNQNMTPYTDLGRELYVKASGKQQRLLRPTVYNVSDLKLTALHQLFPKKKNDKLYNFEYMMNREYAFNRDKGKCKCCKEVVAGFNVHCHHINPYLPLNEVNKVMNLATICKSCHSIIHYLSNVEKDAKTMKKIEKYREKLAKARIDTHEAS
ncbi:group II intron reverse transcriptase/maturase [Ferdinandcohnia sp. SAFN-114]|uniref:group II intron reverse transcriptase/maturase n=1 Tax=Ferdinandcohnia sp. SAFN-114 TaxID=3387275 RepID=UPI003F80E0B3